MADTTPQKRVLPARERRESAAKRQASSPITKPLPAQNNSPAPSTEPRQKRKYTKRSSLVKAVEHSTRNSTSTPGAEDVLPTRLLSSKPLPTSREKQPSDLSVLEYQSIADSAILLASLHRSRMQWLCEGVFKRYWVKPTKRKGVIEQPEGNPDVKSMQKLGNATITVEPHTFEATFYIVRDLTTIAPPIYRHPNQHTPRPPYPPPFNPPQPHLQQPSVGSNNATPQPPVQTSQAPKQENIPASRPGYSGSAPFPNTAVKPANQQVPHPNGPPKPSDDPVIQMLAARAASDSRLKELMKVVAMSQATAEQLKEFQTHIDEFNTIVKKRNEAEGTAGTAKTGAPTTSRNDPPVVKTPSSVGPPMHVPPAYIAYPPPPPPRPEPIIKHVIVEFHSPVSTGQGASTDRWLFPEHAVLEMRAGGMEMIASFFAERSGDDILKSAGSSEEIDETFRQKYKRGQDYYQPVTMVIKATQHRTIETIARAARPLIDVQKHMNEVMEKKTRAPREYLIHHLPRDKVLENKKTDFVDSGVEASDAEDDELKGYYGM